ncbi:MAG: gliding motility lipoprotein GldH [Bacteroidetes bacterium]|nr:gliding motility lipoprotein GldH [Bacteroidota bacterium]MBU1373899.1 gliding motility lipoprotein GldH [Bacteroidota bacterium]MBU1485504.1 gliding motility lipoprotein GldH [Bacteroidota bacterium]MBU1759371.1 gliding motility lipoprotein GldH [Bacteroidota bacterium]MBU2268416.1 gliding motility lipoprotein GldH [Bacteroidota bacterium]
MKRAVKLIFIGVVVAVLQSCNDNALVNTFETIPNQNWSYVNPIKAKVEITDSTKPYNIYLNFRHTPDYNYSNIWLRFHLLGPKLKDLPERKEFELALADGAWLGKGSGNLYNYQLIYKEGYKFPSAGTYTIVVEQNMRDNPLKNISDVGIRVEPAN